MTDPDLIERIARALAEADGLDFDEVCGVDAEPDEGYCDSGTCIATHWEEHDAEQARRWYNHLATAAYAELAPLLAERDAEIAALKRRTISLAIWERRRAGAYRKEIEHD